MAAFARAMIGAGVPAGAAMPNQGASSKPGSTAATGGISGASGKGFAVVTASARTLPSRIWGMPAGKSVKVLSMRPAMTSVSASGPPR